MVKKIIIYIAILFSTLLPVAAQAQQPKAFGGIRISPFQIIYNVKPGTEMVTEVVIANNEKRTVVLEFSKQQVFKDGNKLIIEENKFAESEFSADIQPSSISIDPGQEAKVTVKLRLTTSLIDSNFTPAILVKPAEPEGSATVSINNQFVIPVLASFTKETKHNIGLKLEAPMGLQILNTLNVKAQLQNKNNRYFKPTAMVNIRKGSTLVHTESLTNVMPESLSHGVVEQIDTKFKAELQDFNQYEFELYITDAVTGQSFVGKQSFFYISINTLIILLLLGAILLVAISLVVYLAGKKGFSLRRKKTKLQG